MFEIPRIACRRPRQIERRSAVRELVRLQFAEQNGAGVVELLRSGCVEIRNIVNADFGAARGQHAFGIVDVFQRERYAVQGAAITPAGDFLGGFARLRARGIRGERDEGVELRIERADARQQGVGVFERRELARRQ